MDNRDEIVALLKQIENVTEASYGAPPEDVLVKLPEGSLAFRVTQVFPGDATWSGRTNIGEIYSPPAAFEEPQNNETLVQQMRAVLAEIEVNAVPTPTFDAPVIIPPQQNEVPETEHLDDGILTPNGL